MIRFSLVSHPLKKRICTWNCFICLLRSKNFLWELYIKEWEIFLTTPIKCDKQLPSKKKLSFSFDILKSWFALPFNNRFLSKVSFQSLSVNCGSRCPFHVPSWGYGWRRVPDIIFYKYKAQWAFTANDGPFSVCVSAISLKLSYFTVICTT